MTSLVPSPAQRADKGCPASARILDVILTARCPPPPGQGPLHCYVHHYGLPEWCGSRRRLDLFLPTSSTTTSDTSMSSQPVFKRWTRASALGHILSVHLQQPSVTVQCTQICTRSKTLVLLVRTDDPGPAHSVTTHIGIITFVALLPSLISPPSY